MTPMDLNVARAPGASDNAAVHATSAKSGDGEASHAGGEFHDALKTVAHEKRDNHEEKPAAGKASTGGKSKETSLDRWRRLEAGKAALDGHSGTRIRDKVLDKDAELETSDAEGADKQGGASADETEASAIVSGGAEKVLALILSHPTTQAGGSKKQDAQDAPVDATAQDAATTADAESAAARPLREVKIVSVKVETHFAPIASPAVAASLAQKIANAGTTQKSGEAGTVAATGPAAKADGERLASLKDLDFAQAGTDLRGKAAAGNGVDKRGADGSGNGNAAADAKAALAAGERKAPVDVGDGLNAAPGQAPSPIQQLGQRMAAVANELKAESTAPLTQSGADPSATAGPVRVLSINLHPEELGSVTVRMSLVRDALEVQIEAEHHSTARMLQTDSGALSDMLRNAGIQVDGVTVRAAAPDTVSANTGSSQSMLDPQSQGGAGADARAAGGNGGRQDRQQGFGERASGRGGYEDDTSQRGAAGGLYV